jgi:hypothetical protein
MALIYGMLYFAYGGFFLVLAGGVLIYVSVSLVRRPEKHFTLGALMVVFSSAALALSIPFSFGAAGGPILIASGIVGGVVALSLRPNAGGTDFVFWRPELTRRIVKGVMLVFVGSLLFVGPSVFPGGIEFMYYNNLGLVLGVSWPIVTSLSGYFFGREWGDERILLSALIPAAIFLAFEEAFGLSPQFGSSGTGGGAGFLVLPSGVFVLSLIFAAVGGSKKRAAEKLG